MSLVFTLGVLASLVLAAFLVVAAATLGLSYYNRRADRRRKHTRERVRRQLFEKQREENPDWGAWITGLDSLERNELEGVLERYLRTLRGPERQLYHDLALAVGMGERAAARLDQGTVVSRLRALATLSVLAYPIEQQRLLDTCLDTRRTREAAARLVAERPGEFDSPEVFGMRLLLWETDRSLTPYGQETLYELARSNPAPLLTRARQDADEWGPELLDAVCSVLEHIEPAGPDHQFEWVFPLFGHENPYVRAAAIKVFKRHRERPQLRSRIPFRQLVTDDDPYVRRTTYRILTYWGDDRARQLLEWAVIDEEDARCQLAAVRALAVLDADPATHHYAWPDASWQWVRAELEVTDQPRLAVSNPEVRG